MIIEISSTYKRDVVNFEQARISLAYFESIRRFVENSKNQEKNEITASSVRSYDLLQEVKI